VSILEQRREAYEKAVDAVRGKPDDSPEYQDYVRAESAYFEAMSASRFDGRAFMPDRDSAERFVDALRSQYIITKVRIARRKSGYIGYSISFIGFLRNQYTKEIQ
jgi:hypothetical protein